MGTRHLRAGRRAAWAPSQPGYSAAPAGPSREAPSLRPWRPSDVLCLAHPGLQGRWGSAHRAGGPCPGRAPHGAGQSEAPAVPGWRAERESPCTRPHAASPVPPQVPSSVLVPQPARPSLRAWTHSQTWATSVPASKVVWGAGGALCGACSQVGCPARDPHLRLGAVGLSGVGWGVPPLASGLLGLTGAPGQAPPLRWLRQERAGGGRLDAVPERGSRPSAVGGVWHCRVQVACPQPGWRSGRFSPGPRASGHAPPVGVRGLLSAAGTGTLEPAIRSLRAQTVPWQQEAPCCSRWPLPRCLLPARLVRPLDRRPGSLLLPSCWVPREFLLWSVFLAVPRSWGCRISRVLLENWVCLQRPPLLWPLPWSVEWGLSEPLGAAWPVGSGPAGGGLSGPESRPQHGAPPPPRALPCSLGPFTPCQRWLGQSWWSRKGKQTDSGCASRRPPHPLSPKVSCLDGGQARGGLDAPSRHTSCGRDTGPCAPGSLRRERLCPGRDTDPTASSQTAVAVRARAHLRTPGNCACE